MLKWLIEKKGYTSRCIYNYDTIIWKSLHKKKNLEVPKILTMNVKVMELWLIPPTPFMCQIEKKNSSTFITKNKMYYILFLNFFFKSYI